MERSKSSSLFAAAALSAGLNALSCSTSDYQDEYVDQRDNRPPCTTAADSLATDAANVGARIAGYFGRRLVHAAMHETYVDERPTGSLPDPPTCDDFRMRVRDVEAFRRRALRACGLPEDGSMHPSIGSKAFGSFDAADSWRNSFRGRMAQICPE